MLRFFFVKDRVDKGEFTIEYCNTEAMLADYSTKALQGALFVKHRRVIMGWEHINTLASSTDMERFGNSISTTNAKDTVKKTYASAVKGG